MFRVAGVGQREGAVNIPMYQTFDSHVGRSTVSLQMALPDVPVIAVKIQPTLQNFFEVVIK